MVSAPDVVNDFEAWATVSSRLVSKSDDARAELLAELGVAEVWRNANLAWTRAIASDILEMRLDRARRYAEICARVLDRDTALDLASSLSDDLGLDTTHRIRIGVPSTPPSDRFAAAVGGSDRPVPLPKRGQATTQTVATEIAQRVLSAEDKNDAGDAPLPGDSQTSLLAIPSTTMTSEEPWTVDRYARYVATHEAGQESEEAIDERFGVSDGGALRQRWDERLGADAALTKRYEDLLRTHHEALSTIRR